MLKKIIKNTIVVSVVVILMFMFMAKIISIINGENVYAKPIDIQLLQGEGCLALNYHRVRKENLVNKAVEKITGSKELKLYNVYEEEFAKQMDELIDAGAYFATPEELERFKMEGKYPEKCVWISFDDGDKSVYENAFPILKERGIPFTMFIISGHVGSDDFNNLELATWDELREMKESGLVTFGSHTHDMHYLEDDKAVFLDEENIDEFEEDIKTSKKVLEDQLGIEITSIAYPFGEASDKVNEVAEKSGYSQAFILSPNPIKAYDSPYYQNRYLVDKRNFYNTILPWINKKNP